MVFKWYTEKCKRIFEGTSQMRQGLSPYGEGVGASTSHEPQGSRMTEKVQKKDNLTRVRIRLSLVHLQGLEATKCAKKCSKTIKNSHFWL